MRCLCHCLSAFIHVNFFGRIKAEGLSFNDMYEEVPINIKNSPLSNMLLLKLKKENPVPEKVEYLNLSHRLFFVVCMHALPKPFFNEMTNVNLTLFPFPSVHRWSDNSD